MPTLLILWSLSSGAKVSADCTEIKQILPQEHAVSSLYIQGEH